MGKHAKKEEEKGLVDQATEFAVKPVNVPIINISLEMWQIMLLVFAAYMVWRHQGVEGAAKETAQTAVAAATVATSVAETAVESLKKVANTGLDLLGNVVSNVKQNIDTTTTPVDPPPVPTMAGRSL
jgi:hypothetical protein